MFNSHAKILWDASALATLPLHLIEKSLRSATLTRKMLSVGAGISAFFAILIALAGIVLDVGVGWKLFFSTNALTLAIPPGLRALLLFAAIIVTSWALTGGVKLCNAALRNIVTRIDEARAREQPLQATLKLRSAEIFAMAESAELMDVTRPPQSSSDRPRL